MNAAWPHHAIIITTAYQLITADAGHVSAASMLALMGLTANSTFTSRFSCMILANTYMPISFALYYF